MKKLLLKLIPTVEFWLVIARFLPKRLVYACAVQVLVTATSGEYSRTSVTSVTANKCLIRYARKYGV